MSRRAKSRCPLAAHYAAGGSSCIGCGKTFRQNPVVTPAKARKILHDGKIRGRALTPAQRGFFGARASGYPLRPNPPGAKRIGRVREVRYDRDQGNRQGLYYHKFRRVSAGLWTEPDGTVSIR